MSSYWDNEGQPDQHGRFCRVVNPENGTHPLRFYGRSKDEAIEKAFKTLEHGQRTIAELKNKPSTASAIPSSRPAASVAKISTAITADEQMTLTADLQNPAKSPQAIARLVSAATGLDLNAMARQELIRRISAIQQDWEDANPDFPKHPTNRVLVTQTASNRVGYTNITAEILDTIFQELREQDVLVPALEALPEHQVAPPESPVERPAVQNVGTTTVATSYRKNALRGGAAPAPKPRYTRIEIDKMSSSELLEKAQDPAFVALFDAVQPTRRPNV